jgi:hypothetical protein
MTPTLGSMVVNGRPTMTPKEKETSDYYYFLSDKQKQLRAWDRSGNIAAIVKDPLGLALMKKYARIYFGRQGSDGAMIPHPIDLTNYWKTAGLVSYMKKADLFSEQGHMEERVTWERGDLVLTWPSRRVIKGAGPYQSVTRNEWVIPQPLSGDIRAILDYNDADEIQGRVKRALPLVLTKNINRLAEQNIANYLGVKRVESRVTESGSKIWKEAT